MRFVPAAISISLPSSFILMSFEACAVAGAGPGGLALGGLVAMRARLRELFLVVSRDRADLDEGAARPGGGPREARAIPDALLELRPELADDALAGECGRVGED